MSMDARLIRLALILSVFSSAGATYKGPNFHVTAPTDEIARQVALTAEQCRDELAVIWVGKKLPRWSQPCVITVKVGQLGAGGATTFAFDRGEVFGWRMTVQGTLERILDSVVPHEVNHTILASHFRRPLPRWADEGAATLVEHESEQNRQRLLLQQVWKTSKRIPLRKLLAITEYPSDMQDVLTLYAEGYALADYLVQLGGRARYLQFLDDAHRHGWDRAIAQHYGIRGVETLEQKLDGWMMAGWPRLNLPEGQQLASTDGPARQSDLVVRGQTPETYAETKTPAQLAARPNGAEGATRSLPITGDAKDAHDRALNAGWTPISEPRRPRPEPLIGRVEFEAPLVQTE